jgi:transcriptional regulator with GAF, ATPase, and Fis domain
LGYDYPWPGNVRELEQCVRRLLLNESYQPFASDKPQSLDVYLQQNLSDGSLDLQGLICGYCYLLYQRHGTYEAVAQATGLDRRTAKKHVAQGRERYGHLSV